jgi:hypothetical protein
VKLTILLLTLLVFVGGCAQMQSTPIPVNQEAASLCNQICKSYDKNLSNGPCLSDNNPDWTVNDWVCDVAHSPRQDVDNLPENQCSAFREGKASHFVEVDNNCNLIRKV